MDDQLAAFLDELYSRGREHDADKEDRLERLRNVEPETAKLLAVLGRSIRPARILELGTSNGYSTVWLADAARATGAELVSVEIDPARTQEARARTWRPPAWMRTRSCGPRTRHRRWPARRTTTGA